MPSVRLLGAFSPARTNVTEEELSELRAIWPQVQQRQVVGLDPNFESARVTSISTQIVNGKNLAYVVENETGSKHRVVVHFPGAWNAVTTPEILSVEKLVE